MDYKCISINDELYPQQLREISDPPQMLFCLGDISLLKMNCYAVVGTRRCSPYGRWAAYEISKRIAQSGACVVSGMAEGIDTQGHLGAIECRGRTIAVLGTGIDVCFPKSNKKLYERLVEEQLVISEYEPGDKTGAWSFPQRNRIISGLSKAVIVVEGALKSGSMITANLALEQGRDVYAVPGNINQPNSVGVNSLIRDGAYPILSMEELEEILGLEKNRLEIDALCENEAKIYELLKYEPGLNIEMISYKLYLSISETGVLLTALELKGFVRKEGTRYYIF